MQTMVTVTANDNNPEMLAAIRRGPFATPTEEEYIEYLLKRKPRDGSLQIVSNTCTIADTSGPRFQCWKLNF